MAGDLTVLIATESFELGVDNPNITQVIRIGCPRNLGVLLQELGRAGRKEQSSANGLLLVVYQTPRFMDEVITGV